MTSRRTLTRLLLYMCRLISPHPRRPYRQLHVHIGLQVPSASEGGQLKQSTFKFYHTTLIPDQNLPSPATVSLVDIRKYVYHLHIYALAEELNYETLQSAAHAKLVKLLVFHSFSPVILEDTIKTIFAPAGTAECICKDEDGALQQLIVAAVIAQLTTFTDSIQGPEYADFHKIYTAIKDEAEYLIKQSDIAKQLAAERKAGRDRRKAAKSRRGNEDKNKTLRGDVSPMGTLGARTISQKGKSKRRHEEKLSVGAVAKANGDEDMDMEID